MAKRFYIVPKSGDGLTKDTAFRPKYLDAIGGWAAMDLGLEPTMLVCGEVTNAQHTSINANADVIAVPQNLDTQVGANLATVQANLESVNIPADWITSGMTYRDVLRWITRLFVFHQRAARLIGKFFAAGFTLDSLIGDIPQEKRQQLNSVAQNLGIDTSAITLSTTVRQAFRILADQLPAAPSLNGVQL